MPLDCVRLDTEANMKSVMGRVQYDAYQKVFGLRIIIRSLDSEILRVIGSSVVALGVG